MTLPDMKICIKDEEHSKAVQEALFNIGYDWRGEKHASIQHTEYPAIYTDSYGAITYASLDLYNSMEYFNDCNMGEYFLTAMGEFRKKLPQTLGDLIKRDAEEAKATAEEFDKEEFIATLIATRPVSLRPKAVVDGLRMQEILTAMLKSVQAGAKIDNKWLCELDDLNDSLEEAK